MRFGHNPANTGGQWRLASGELPLPTAHCTLPITMPFELNMPQLSDTMTEGTLVKWNKKEGDAVKAGEEIADVETDKATMPMECAEAGTLAILLVPEGGK